MSEPSGGQSLGAQWSQATAQYLGLRVLGGGCLDGLGKESLGGSSLLFAQALGLE